MGLGKTYSTQYLLDSNNSSGVAGQVLSTTSTGIDWADANTLPGSGLWLENGNDIYNSNSGNVGIGVTSPNAKLHIAGGSSGMFLSNLGDNSAYDSIKMSYGGYNSGTPEFIFTQTSTPGSGIANTWYRFKNTNGVEGTNPNNVANVTIGGKLGIGTDSPGTTLDVNGAARIMGAAAPSSGAGLELYYSGGTSNILSFDRAGLYKDINISALSTKIFANGSQAVTVLSGGNVGIGTTSPDTKLEVRTDSGAAVANSYFRVTAGAQGAYGGTAHFEGAYNDYGNVDQPNIVGKIDMASEIVTPTDVGGTMKFFTKATGGTYATAPIERMRITSSGNIGIGGDTSAWSLGKTIQINGAYGAINYNGVSAILGIVNAYYNGSGYIRQNVGYAASIDFNTAVSGGGLAFRTENSTGAAGDTISLTTKVAILSNGRVGIGTTTVGTLHGVSYGPTMLHVDGGSSRGQMILEGDQLAGVIMSDNGATANERVFSTMVDGGNYQIKPINDNGTSTAAGAAITVLHNSNVGIGTTGPISKLDIVQPDSSASTLGQSATASLGIRMANAVGQVGQIVFNNDDGPSYGYGSIGMIMTSGSGVGLGDMIFSTKSTGVDNPSTERMRITSGGNVGINETSPDAKLHIMGDTGLPATSGTTFTGTMRLGVSGGYGTVMDFGGVGPSTGTQWIQVTDSSNQAIQYPLLLQPNGGNVGIGTTNPAFPLEVENASTAYVFSETTGAATSSGYRWKTPDSEFAWFSTGGTNALNLYDYVAGATRMIIDSSGNLKLNAYGAGYLKTDGNGAVTAESGIPGTGTFLPLAGGTMTGTSGIEFPENFKLKWKDSSTSTEVFNIYSAGGTNYINSGDGTNSVKTKFVVGDGGLEINSNDPVGSIAHFDTGGLAVNGNITAQKAGDVFVNSIVSSGSTTGRAFFKSIGDTGSVLVSTVYGSASTGTIFGVSSTRAASILTTSDTSVHPTSLLIGTFTEIPLYLGTNNSARITILGNGNVGIGYTAPDVKLVLEETPATIVGGNAINGSTMKGIKIRTNLNGDESVGLWFGTNGSHWSGISGQRKNAASTWGTTLSFYTHEDTAQDLTYSRERMIIDTGGNVGIGTSSPATPLTVAGNFLVRTTTADSYEDRFRVEVGGSSDSANVYVYNLDATARIRLNAGGDSYLNGGNVGIGVTGPDVKFHVTASEDGSGIDKGTAKFINTATGSGATTMHIVQTTADSFGNAIKFWQGATPSAVGFIRLTTSATQFITSASDLNLKKNITNWSDDTLSKFKALEPKKFRFKTQDASEDKTLGFIAQNEVDNFPEAYPQFLGEDEKPYYGFNPSGMVPHLMKAIKDLVEKVEILENKITQLEN